MIVLDCKYYISREWWRSKRCDVLAGGGRASLVIAVVQDGAHVQRLRPSLRRLYGRDRGATSDAPHAPGIGEVSCGRSPQVSQTPSAFDALARLIPWICGGHQSGTGNRWDAAFLPLAPYKRGSPQRARTRLPSCLSPWPELARTIAPPAHFRMA